jgi:hypothetical protein
MSISSLFVHVSIFSHIRASRPRRATLRKRQQPYRQTPLDSLPVSRQNLPHTVWLQIPPDASQTGKATKIALMENWRWASR